MYEGYASGGVALLVECLTDNKNRAAAEVRTAMSRNGGTLADPGSVAYNFSRKGVIVVPAEGTTEDDVLAAVLEAGAEEVTPQGESFEVLTEASELVATRTALQEAGIDYDSADVEFVASVKVNADAETARKVFRLIDALEDSDDVQNVYTNLDLSPEVQAELEEDED
jgi:YebC/PmpR family DNA-binding regulatory protein